MDQQMSNLLQMMQAMQATRQDGTAFSEGYGRGVPPLTLMETFMPFMPPQQQKSIGAILQLMELCQSFANYADMAVNRQSPGSPDWRYELLASMQPHFSPKKRRMIDIMFRMIEINDMLNEYNRFGTMGGARYDV